MQCAYFRGWDDFLIIFKSFTHCLIVDILILFSRTSSILKFWSFCDDIIQCNFLRQTTTSGCEGFPTFRDLTPSQSSGCAGGLVSLNSAIPFISVAEQSKKCVCGRSLARIEGYNPAAGTWISLSWQCCVNSGRVLLRSDRSSRGVLPSVGCVWLW